MSPEANEEVEELTSTLGFPIPPSRGSFLNVGELWLDDKRVCDGAEGFWRIHNKLYNFSNFINVHPGGEDWLILTKGTDITEAFESHHIQEFPRNLIQKYYVRDATLPRCSPFTFEENGFYKTIQRRVRKFLPKIPEESSRLTKNYIDIIFVTFLTFSLLSARYQSFTFGTLAGCSLAALANSAHNFFHQRDNFRMYYFEFTLMSSKSWRIIHILSHHLFANTVIDLEISMLEPFLKYLPQKKSVFVKCLSWLISPFLYGSAFIGYFIRMLIAGIVHKKAVKAELILPIMLFVAIATINSSTIWSSALIFLYIEISGSFVFMFVGLNAAHHHPGLFHDGDVPRPKEELDWGVYQIDTIKDRPEFRENTFLVLINFGNHILHHLFPTLDHGKLKYLYPIFLETCKEFNLDYRTSTQLKLIQAQFLQLIHEKRRLKPPKPYLNKDFLTITN